MDGCTLCPRMCGADRRRITGYCGSGSLAKVARAAKHHWEEPCISGTEGSGTVFFSGCNLRCVYCQNRRIALGDVGTTVSVERLAEIYLELQEQGAHNINLVTPAHETDAVVRSLERAKRQGLKIACLEGIAYRHGWITEERMRELAQPMLKNQYGQYLLRVIDEVKHTNQVNHSK